MKINVQLWLFTAVAAFIGMIVAAFAHPGMGGMGMGGPPSSVTMGPPAGVPMGPPAGIPPSQAISHIPNGAPLGQPATVPQNGAATAGDSIGASVSAHANAHASADAGMDGADTATSAQINAADELGGLNAAHANSHAFQHANSHSMVGAIATYQTQMKAALALTDTTAQDVAITSARQQLAAATNKTLTASAVTKLDGILGITGASATLGTSQ